jgi:uncharacterized protein (TIGR03089 family)
VNLLVADLLRARIRTAGADPLITYYDVPRGERVELSAVTFGNWVAKVANLLTFEVSLGPGEPVALPLAATAPGHWMTAVWQVAIWQVGAYVDLSPAADRADVCVCGPDWQPYADSPADVLACSLHPFATGLGGGVPASVADVDLAVRAQPDSYSPSPIRPSALAWVDADRRLTQADLVAGPVEPGRRLLVPTDPWGTARDGIVTALLGGGSVVTVVGGTADDLAKIVAAELVDAPG